MPRIFGLNMIAVLVAAIALYFVGFIFYGLLFAEMWVSLWNFSEEQIAAMETNAGPSMAMGFVISLATAAFMGWAMKALKVEGIVSAAKTGAMLWAGFALTTLAYDTVYAGQSTTLLLIDAFHLLVGFKVAAVVYVLMDGVAVKD